MNDQKHFLITQVPVVIALCENNVYLNIFKHVNNLLHIPLFQGKLLHFHATSKDKIPLKKTQPAIIKSLEVSVALIVAP